MKRFVSLLAIALAGVVCLPAGAQAEFGFSEFDVTFTNSAGLPATQAGSHPFVFTTSFEANTDGEDTDGRMKDLFLDLPPGLLFDAGAAPRCAQANFLSGACSPETVVGLATIEAEEPGLFEDTRIYALVPDDGELLRLGFEVADIDDVLVDVFLAPDPPHDPIAVVGEWPETFDVFSAQIELWGAPAEPAHDPARGNGVAGPVLPFLTLPTRCDEALETFYVAESWLGEDDSGSALTRDGGGNPMGLAGCNILAFEPSVAIGPTTEAAQSPTGLHLSFGFDDEGLGNPAGLAQSQLRDLVLALPEGMKVNPSAAEGLGICAETDFDDEGPEELEGEGCPDSSTIGSLEVASPLLGEDTLAGAVYLGAPLSELAKGSAIELYAVARNPTLGIVLKQLVEVEPDPETGQLVLYAESLPQLPFSRLDVDLFDGEGSPLISPPRCGDYEIEAELTPWADYGDYLFRPEFSLDGGPDGGPCPPGESTQPPSGDGAPVPAVAAAPPVIRPSVRPCPRGKRAIRRNGVRHCMKRCPKSKRKARRKGAVRCVKKRSCRKSKRMVRRQGKVRCVKRSGHHRYP